MQNKNLKAIKEKKFWKKPVLKVLNIQATNSGTFPGGYDDVYGDGFS